MLCIGRSRGQNPPGLRPLGFWPWDLPTHNIHHDTSSAFSNNVPLSSNRALLYFTVLSISQEPYLNVQLSVPKPRLTVQFPLPEMYLTVQLQLSEPFDSTVPSNKAVFDHTVSSTSAPLGCKEPTQCSTQKV